MPVGSYETQKSNNEQRAEEAIVRAGENAREHVVGDVDISSVADEQYEVLIAAIREAEQDYKIGVPEVIPRTINLYRKEAAKIAAAMRTQKELLEQRPDKNAIRRIEALAAQLSAVNERIADEIKTWQELLLYFKYDAVYYDLKDQFLKQGMLPSAIAEDAEWQHREEQAQIRKLQLLNDMERRANLATVILLEFRSRAMGDKNATADLPKAVDAYNACPPNVPKTEHLPPLPTFQDLDARRLKDKETLRAHLNYSPGIAELFVLYQEYARAQPGSYERKVKTEQMRAASAIKTGDAWDVQAAKHDMQKFLAGKMESVIEQQKDLPTASIEGIILTADLLTAQIDQIIRSHKHEKLTPDGIQRRAEARDALVEPLNEVLRDLELSLYLRSREAGGWENIRGTYGGEIPEPERVPTRIGETGGLGKQLSDIALRNAEELLEHFKGGPSPTTLERLSPAAKRVMDSARRLLRKVKELDEILKTPEDSGASVPEVLARDDAQQEHLKEDLQLRILIIEGLSKAPAHPDMPLEEMMAMTRQAQISTEELQAARQPYLDGTTTRLSEKDIKDRIANPDPKDIVILWHQLDAQTLHDLGTENEVRRGMFKELAHGAATGEQKELEQKLVEEKVKENLRIGAKLGWKWFEQWFKEHFGFSVWWVIGGMTAVGVIGADAMMHAYTGLSPLRAGGRVAGGGARLAGRTAAGGLRKAGEIIGRLASRQSAGVASETVKTAAETAGKASRLTRAGGHALFLAAEVLTAAEIARRMNIGLRMKPLSEKEAAQSAYEFMTTHPNVNRNALRYGAEVKSLEQHCNLIDMRGILDATCDTLPAEENILADEGNSLLEKIENLNLRLHHFFPVTELFTRSDADPAGVLRVRFDELNSARETGIKNHEEDLKKTSKPWSLLAFFKSRPKPPPSLATVEPMILELSPKEREDIEKMIDDMGAVRGPYEEEYRELEKEYEEYMNKAKSVMEKR